MKKRKRIPKDKPLLSMSEGELTRTLDDIGEDIHRSILQAARRAPNDVVLALVVIDIPGLGSRIVTYDAEYGDGEGTAHADSFVRLCTERELLKTGEKLRRIVWKAAPVGGRYELQLIDLQ